MTNINQLIKMIKRELGLSGLLNNIYPDSLLKDNIINISLREYNSFTGYYIQIGLDKALSEARGSNSSSPYYSVNIPYSVDSYTEIHMRLNEKILEPIYGMKVRIKNVVLERNQYVANMYYSTGIKDDLALMHGAELNRINYQPPKAEFRPPNTVVLTYFVRNYQYDLAWNLRLNVTHPSNLSTITDGIFYDFKELCKCNIAIDILNNELKYLNVNLGNSTVELNLDNLTNAETYKQEIIARIRAKSNIDNQTVVTHF